ncbi:ArsR/SmtB family transcription factor [Kribbella steppae]|nr:winged helix-turn-helix domain-containing protein [Kribbella steppae]
MAIHITMTADQLGRSRFAISPAQEVVSTVRLRADHPARHARTWYARAQALMPAGELGLLEALVPADHNYAPDFLTPPPARSVATIADQAGIIARTSPDDIERQLDIGLRGRPVRDDVVALFGDEETYRRWRRPAPEALERVMADGPEAVAVAAAKALQLFFELAIEPDWGRTTVVLDDDIRRKSDLLASRGAVAMLNDLGRGMVWDGSGLVLDRPYDVTVDWADDGVLLIPASTHVGPVQFTVKCPEQPAVVYRSNGIARLWQRDSQVPNRALADLLGDTRAVLLTELAEHQSTKELSSQLPWSAPTVSYHLQVLLRAGLVERSRRGNRVVYRRTAIGDSLVGT